MIFDLIGSYQPALHNEWHGTGLNMGLAVMLLLRSHRLNYAGRNPHATLLSAG